MTATISPAHPLFPAHQAFLWLPGLPGDQNPYCSYNERHPSHGMRGDRWVSGESLHDANMAPYAPPYPVSPETFITWHTNVSPPFPFHPVPIARSLSGSEMEELARRVAKRMNLKPDAFRHPLQVLKNDSKCFVLASLADMGLLAGTTSKVA
jgi:hypothetical protein